MSKLSRRNFIKASGMLGVAGMGGMQLGFGKTLFNKAAGDNQRELLVYVFLNGGMDGLHMVPPRSGADYTHYSNTLRPALHIENTASIPLNGTTLFGMHPNVDGMATLFNANKMAIVHATGLYESNRSHFEATRFMEQGLIGNSSNPSGWLTRYFESSLHTPENARIPSMVPSYNNTDAVLGDPAALVMASPTYFALTAGHWSWEDYVQTIMTQINTNPDTLEKQAAFQTLSSSNIVQSIDWENYTPGNGAVYPDAFIGNQLKYVAQMYKSNVDLEVAYVPSGGWDTHTNQVSIFNNLSTNLSQALYAFYQDLSATHQGSFTIIVQSEFGRRAYQNSDDSTDHGYGNPMFIIGDNINPGFHGTFPGLSAAQLFEGQDLATTTDYRHVVSEILIKRMKNRMLGYIFPGYDNYSPLGVAQGIDLPPIYEQDYNPIFGSGFE